MSGADVIAPPSATHESPSSLARPDRPRSGRSKLNPLSRTSPSRLPVISCANSSRPPGAIATFLWRLTSKFWVDALICYPATSRFRLALRFWLLSILATPRGRAMSTTDTLINADTLVFSGIQYFLAGPSQVHPGTRTIPSFCITKRVGSLDFALNTHSHLGLPSTVDLDLQFAGSVFGKD